MTDGVHVRPADWEADEIALRRVRTEVFVHEQQVDADEEWDGRDASALHFLAVDDAGEAIGTVRLLPDRQIGRMAVLSAHRGSGIGAALLDAAVAAAAERGDPDVFLNAQVHALEFYRRAGFEVVGDEFMEAGIAHRRMEMGLGIPFEADPDSSYEIVNPDVSAHEYALPALSELPDDLRMLGGETDVRDALIDLVQHARREIVVYAQVLDPRLFESSTLTEAISVFLRRHAHSRLTVLMHDSRRMVQEHFALLALSRRLSSSTTMRLVHPDMRDREDTFVVVDRVGVLGIPRSSILQGFANHNDRPLARQYANLFWRMEQRSVPDPYLRTMSL